MGIHVWNLAAQLKRRGHRVGIITRGSLSPTLEANQDGITIWRVPFVPAYPLHVHLHGYFVNRLLRRIESQFDLVNEHTPLPPVAITSLPIVTTVHSPMNADSAATRGASLHSLLVRLQTPVSQRIETALFRRSKRITAVAGWVALALQAYGIAPADVEVTGNAVEACFLDAPSNGKRDPFVLYIGRVVPGKGLDELVEAAQLMLRQRQDANLRFVIVGKGPLLGRLCDRVSQAGLQKYFDFRGHIGADRRDELVRLYQSAGIFCLPSHHEGMPTVLLEAMACGMPVVASAVGGCLEVVNGGENGLLVPPRDPETLAEALLTLLGDEALRCRLGQNARRTIERRFSWKAVTERYLACYEQVVNGQGRP